MSYKCTIIANEMERSRNQSRRVLSVLIITITICLLELVGGIVSKSYALIADAGHMLTDSASLIICYFAALIARKQATREKTYGYFRVEIISALINGTLLLMLSLFVIYNGVRRYFVPFEINGDIMLIVSSIGLVANILGIFLLKGHTHNLNIRGALLHILGDTLSSVGVVIGSLLIIFFNLNIVDAVLSTLIGLLIFYNAIMLIRDAVNVLMESVPPDIDIEGLIADIKSEFKEILDIHDVHIWSISSGIYILTMHITTDASDIDRTDHILEEIRRILRDRYHIEHSTIQIESPEFKKCS